MKSLRTNRHTPAIAGTRGSIRAPRRVVAARAAVKLPRWEEMWQQLVQAKLQSVSPKAAADMVDSGEWVLVDVRPTGNNEQAAPEAAVSVPLFQKLDFSQAGPSDWLRAAAYAFNGVAPIEFNPNFIEDLNEKSGGKQVIMMCETGGTLRPSVNFIAGKTSRSLKAAYRAMTEGNVKGVAHLDGGMYAWYLAGLPIRGEYNTENVGRTPNAAAEPTGIPESPVEVKSGK